MHKKINTISYNGLEFVNVNMLEFL